MLPRTPFIVQAEAIIIGTVAFTGWDSGMGVAFGAFRPNEYYRSHEHATQISGSLINRSNELRLVWPNGRSLTCEAVGLIDDSAEIGDGDREVIAFGVTDKAFWNGS